MDKNSVIHCRLCAKVQRKEDTLNFTNKLDENASFWSKIELLNQSVIDIEENLPKTVCLQCICALDKTVDFIKSIQCAQVTLRCIFNEIKTEIVLEDLRVLPEPEYHSVQVKIEEEPFKNDYEATYIKKELCGLKKEDTNTILSKQNIPIKKNTLTTKFSREKVTIDKNKVIDKSEFSWKDYSWFCSICELSFPTIQEITTHSIEKHKNCTTYKCTYCNKRKLILENFITHVKGHKQSLKLYCHFCFMRFTDSQTVEQHIKSHFTGDYKCQGCNTCFSNVNDLDNHKEKVYVHHRRAAKMKWKEGDRIACEVCNKEFENRANLYCHRQQHKDRKKQYVCEQCGKSFYFNCNLKDHMMRHNNEKPHQCKICKSSFRNLRQLRSHITIHEYSKQFSCDQCSKKFRNKTLLAAHKRLMHSNASLHVCTECGKEFKLKYLKRHQLQHSGIKPYSCTICHREFASWGNWNKHMKRKHGMDMAKTKRTVTGTFPVNPVTGEIQVAEINTAETEEWKKTLKRCKKSQNKDNNNCEQSLTQTSDVDL